MSSSLTTNNLFYPLSRREIDPLRPCKLRKFIEDKVDQNISRDIFSSSLIKLSEGEGAGYKIARVGPFVAISQKESVSLWNAPLVAKIWAYKRDLAPLSHSTERNLEYLLVDEKGTVSEIYKETYDKNIIEIYKNGVKGSQVIIEGKISDIRLLDSHLFIIYSPSNEDGYPLLAKWESTGNLVQKISFKPLVENGLAIGRITINQDYLITAADSPFKETTSKIHIFNIKNNEQKIISLTLQKGVQKISALFLKENRLYIGSCIVDHSSIFYRVNPKNPYLSILNISTNQIEKQIACQDVIGEVNHLRIIDDTAFFQIYNGQRDDTIWGINLKSKKQTKICILPSFYFHFHFNFPSCTNRFISFNYSIWNTDPKGIVCSFIYDLKEEKIIKKIDYEISPWIGLMSFQEGVVVIPGILNDSLVLYTEDYYASPPTRVDSPTLRIS